jgi:hypothetical protein
MDELGWTKEALRWHAPVIQPVVNTIILDDNITVNWAMQCMAGEKEAKVGVGVLGWWIEMLRTEGGRVLTDRSSLHSWN